MSAGETVQPFRHSDVEADPTRSLETSCSECEGRGIAMSASWRAWLVSRDELHTELDRAAGPIEAAIMAARIDEHAYLAPPEPREWLCLNCDGVGSLPTEFGHALLAFLQRHDRRDPPKPGWPEFASDAAASDDSAPPPRHLRRE